MEKLDISILYVEDEEYIRNNMAKSLLRRVETIHTASNGEEGLEKFKEFEPDLVITDIRMPVMNGLDMIKKIRRLKNTTKIIMLSAHSDTRSLLEAIEIGVNGYILKPFQTKQLFKLIEDLAEYIILDKKVKLQSLRINELYNALVKDLETAGSVQEYLLPDYLIIEPDIFFTSTYVPSSRIGGDLYDIIKLSETEYICYIGDISGHGVKAALLMTAVKTTINRIIEDEKRHEPFQILNRLSTILTRELFSGDYMTLMLCYINCQEHYIRSLNAGHPPLIIYNKENKSIKTHHTEGSIPIGWLPNYVYTPDEENEMDFNTDEILFLYTDGLFECENTAGEELGITGLKKFIERKAADNPTAVLPQKIRETLVENHYDISSDDFTLVAFSKIHDKTEIKGLSFFSGNIRSELNLIIAKAAKYTRHLKLPEAFSTSLENLDSEWLCKLINAEMNCPDKEIFYLADIEQAGNDALIITIWFKTLRLETDKHRDNLARKTPLIFTDLTITVSSSYYTGFQEMKLNVQKTGKLKKRQLWK
ncbi:MAG: SpoIIE family protein phosphatase [Candidatus Cloacimonetes bacterium]|nr:SpoIIE family protein phosphatase [Candidatus Cloacimonadota bacterium]